MLTVFSVQIHFSAGSYVSALCLFRRRLTNSSDDYTFVHNVVSLLSYFIDEFVGKSQPLWSNAEFELHMPEYELKVDSEMPRIIEGKKGTAFKNGIAVRVIICVYFWEQCALQVLQQILTG